LKAADIPRTTSPARTGETVSSRARAVILDRVGSVGGGNKAEEAVGLLAQLVRRDSDVQVREDALRRPSETTDNSARV
jgi:hypothetical protein